MTHNVPTLENRYTYFTFVSLVISDAFTNVQEVFSMQRCRALREAVPRKPC